MLKQAGEALVPTFPHARGVFDGFPFFGIEVDIEVGRLQDLEVEGLVLDLVAPEVLAGRRAGKCDKGKNRRKRGSERRCRSGGLDPAV